MGRVNYGRFQSLITNERSSITDRELFCSRSMARHFEGIAKAQTRRYGYKRRVSVSLDWRPNDERFACTDDNEIYINCANRIAAEQKTRIDRYRLIYGLFAHELGHILYTDLLSMQSYQKRILSGAWYPREPGPKSPEHKRYVEDIQEYCAQSEQHRVLYMHMGVAIFNMLEDGYVDERMQQQYAGALGQNLGFANLAAWEWMPSLTQLIDKEPDDRYKWASVMQLIIEYCRFGELLYGDVRADDERVQLLYSLIPTLDKGLKAHRTRDRFTSVNMVMIQCWLYIKAYLEAHEERMQQDAKDVQQAMEEMHAGLCGDSGIGKGTQPPAAAIQNSTSKDAGALSAGRSSVASQLKQMIQNAAQQQNANGQQETDTASDADSGTTELAGASADTLPEPDAADSGAGPGAETAESEDGGGPVQEHDDGHDDNAQDWGGFAEEYAEDAPEQDDDALAPGKAGGCTDPQTVTAEEQGRIPNRETQSIQSTGNGDMERDDDYLGSGYRQAGEDIERMLSHMAEARVEEQRTEALNELAQEILYNDVHKDVDKRVHRMAEVDEQLIEAYDSVAGPLLQISRRLQKSMERQIQLRRKGNKQTGLYVGRRLNVPALPRDDGRVFYKSSLPNKKSALAVALLLDESGSMCSCDRATYARATAIILHDFCEALHIPVMIYGHTTNWDHTEGVDLFSYAEFETVDRLDKYRLMDISARGANRDGCALQYVMEQLAKRQEDARLLILVSDGQPNDSGYSGTAAEDDLRSLKMSCRRKGIHLVAAAIGSDKDRIERIYGDSYLDITNLEELPVRMTEMVKRFIRL